MDTILFAAASYVQNPVTPRTRDNRVFRKCSMKSIRCQDSLKLILRYRFVPVGTAIHIVFAGHRFFSLIIEVVIQVYVVL